MPLQGAYSFLKQYIEVLVSDTALFQCVAPILFVAEWNPGDFGVGLVKKHAWEAAFLSLTFKKGSCYSGSRFSSHFYLTLKLLIKVMQDTLLVLHHLVQLLSDVEESAKLSFKNNVLSKIDLNGYIG